MDKSMNEWSEVIEFFSAAKLLALTTHVVTTCNQFIFIYLKTLK